MRYYKSFLLRTAPLIVCIVFAVIWVNAQFIRSGMLAPNFGVIHQAYAFNFNYLPVTCILVALISIFELYAFVLCAVFCWSGEFF